MDQKSYQKLEFDRILNMLADRIAIEPNKKRAIELEPFTDEADLQKALNEVTEAQSLILRRGNPPIYSINQVLAHLKRLTISALLREQELLDIAALLKTVRQLKDYASEDRELGFYFDGLMVLKKLEDEITSKIISPEEIADNASIKLYTVRKKIKAAHDKIKEILNKIILSPTYQKYLQDNLVTMRGDRFVVPVKVEHKGDIPGIVHDSSASGSTVFVEPMAVVEANNALKELFLEEQKEIERILYELTAMASLHSQELINNYELVCDLDFLFAKAKLGISMKASRPVVNKRGYLNLKKARHPLIDEKQVVPIDIELGGSFDSLIITGPNTGGKTVSLKTVGLLCLMGLSGLLIPAFDKSEISFFSNIYADIGDEQSIAQSLSTFSAHMTNIVSILDQAEYQSLALFDELGAGTDPVEGASLAIGIIEHLRERGVRVMATTHYSELKLYALSTKGVQNASCEFDVETLRPTYKLLIGVPGKSNAFAISKKLGLSEEVLLKAKSQLKEENVQFEDILAEIEKTRILLKKEREQADQYRREAEGLRIKLEEQTIKSEEKYAKIIQQANIEAKEILEEARESATSLIKELQTIRKNESQKEFDRKTSRVREGLSEKIRNKNRAVSSGNVKKSMQVNPNTLMIGTSVRLIDHDQPATVSTLPDANGDLFVTAGILKIKTNVSNLSLDEQATKKETTYTTNKRVQLANKQMSTELDLRGQTVIDGVMDAEKYIDDAVMLRLEKVTIIHGKGTGALRAAIHQMLKGHPQVKSYRLGSFGEGETGVTIVELK